ncbi:Retrovirus-related Pol polyprotein from transposon 17.6 [Vitis vinifera]|uniref:Retrovirus-related Pol polyprotein from transposon 17.6 n=1 Tax=Vitis vinifera TaxID=29760 RepID=A0A438CJ70_VITVI|nr:Retrovirus-related Pol polyprotein from transposon 17.6 [Vitis vinifera]
MFLSSLEGHFFATSNAIINCRNGLMQLTFGNMTLELNIFYMSKKLITSKKEEGPEEVCIIDTLVKEHCNQNMQDKLNESLEDLEEGLSEPVDVFATLQVLKRCKKAIGWQISDLKGINPLVCTHHIYMEEEVEPILQPQRRLNPHLQEVVRAEVLKLLQAGIIYPISDNPWVSPTQEMGTQGISKLKLMLTTFTCPFGTYTYRRMPFGLCNAPATFQRCMLSIFSDMVERIMKVFMDDSTIYGGIVLGHIISEKGIEVDKAKVELIVKLPSPTTVKGVRQFLGHVGFYRRFIKDFSKLSKPLCELLAKDAKFIWDERCQKSFDQLKQFLTIAPIVRAPNRKTLNEAQRNYTTTEKELLVVVFALDKFRAYLVGSFIIAFTDHSALKDKKGVENVVADHLSRETPWYAHIVNYLVTGEVPSEWKTQDKKHLFAKIHAYYWEEPFLFKYCADQIIRKCVPEQEQQGILGHCHENACGGHFASQKQP